MKLPTVADIGIFGRGSASPAGEAKQLAPSVQRGFP